MIRRGLVGNVDAESSHTGTLRPRKLITASISHVETTLRVNVKPFSGCRKDSRIWLLRTYSA